MGLTTEERAAILRAIWVTLADADVHVFGAIAGEEVAFSVRVFGTVRTLTFNATIADWFSISDWSDVDPESLTEIRQPVGTALLVDISPPLVRDQHSK